MGVEQVMPERNVCEKQGKDLARVLRISNQRTSPREEGSGWAPCRVAGEELIYPTRFDDRSVFVVRHPSFLSSFYRT